MSPIMPNVRAVSTSRVLICVHQIIHTRRLNFWMWMGLALQLSRTKSKTITSKLRIFQQSLWVCHSQLLGLWRLPYNCRRSSILLEYTAATNHNRFHPVLAKQSKLLENSSDFSSHLFHFTPCQVKMWILGHTRLEVCRGQRLAGLAKCCLPVRVRVLSHTCTLSINWLIQAAPLWASLSDLELQQEAISHKNI